MALTHSQLKELRRSPVGDAGNRIAAAVALAEVTLVQVKEATGLNYSYVSDVKAGRNQHITVENARKFAEFFGCSIEDLFPARQALTA